MPKARTISLIYADMPQSRSYRRWLELLFAEDPRFRDMRIVFRASRALTDRRLDA